MCGKKLYFKANCHEDKLITWKPEIDVRCELF